MIETLKLETNNIGYIIPQDTNISYLQDEIIVKNQNISVNKNVIKHFFGNQTPFKIIFLIKQFVNIFKN